MTEDYVFNKKDFTKDRLPKGDYEYCTFKNCDFSGSFLSEVRFLECDFLDCNLSTANISGTTFQNVAFQGSKLLGLHFETCNTFGLDLKISDCQLNQASFYQLTLKDIKIIDSKLYNVDFSETDLTNACFDYSDLQHAIFKNSILEKADFRKAINYTINPELNKVKGAKFSLDGIIGLLETYQIHIE